MSVPTQNTTVVTDGIGRLTGPYPGLPNIVGFLKSFLQQKQTIENALYPALLARTLANATLYAPPQTNFILDVIGRIVGQPRQGLSDADYRSILYLRIAVNRSGARIIDWSNIAAILLRTAGGPVQYLEGGTAEFYLFVGDMELNPVVVASVLYGAKGNGIGSSFGYTMWADGNDFEFDDANNTSTTGQGPFGDAVGGAVGGLLVSVAGVG